MFKAKSWRFRGNELKYVKTVLNAGFKAGTDGAYTTKLERKFSNVYGTKYSIAFNSGTSTLHSIFLAINCGPGDEVLVPALTPLMCGLSIHYTGATPVYVDSDPDTFLIDTQDLESKISEKTKAILVVHMYGGVCDMSAIQEISERYRLPIIEDCAQCHGGLTSKGQLAGTIGLASSWSFENSKHLTSGDGGIVTTNDEKLAIQIRKIGGLGFKTLTAESGKVRTDRDKLQNPDWERFDTIGFNFRMNQLAAAVALAQVERQDFFINLRRQSGLKYRDSIKNSSFLEAQKDILGSRNSFFTFSAKYNGENYGVPWVKFRQQFIKFGGDGIYSAAKLLYQEPIFKKLNVGIGKAPMAEVLQKKLMNFTTNQSNLSEINKQCDILLQTRKYFGDL
jgi:perosamine synthetase